MTAEMARMAAEVWDDAGNVLLGDVKAWLGRYICTVAESDLDLLTLWAVHTHLALETYTTPRLMIDSPMPGSGKTTCLEHLQRLCLAPVQMATLSSPAMLARMLDQQIRTLLIDEADRSLNADKDGIADLLAVLNSGYKRGATRPVLVPAKGGEWVVKEMPTYAPVAMAGNNPNLPEDTRSRTIRVLLLPDMDGRAGESDWELIEDSAVALAGRVAAWADQIRSQMKECRPALPDGIVGRFREKWAPLRRVAELAGGDWPAAVDAMAIQDKEQWEMDKEDGLVRERPAVLLLRHLESLWPDDVAFKATSDIVKRLVAEHPATWSAESTYGRDLTAQRFGRMLATSYKINSTRLANDGPRGYTRASLAAVWSRMRITPSIEPAEPAEPAQPAHPALAEPVEPVEPFRPVHPGPPTDRTCPECGQPVHAGQVRHPACYRQSFERKSA